MFVKKVGLALLLAAVACSSSKGPSAPPVARPSAPTIAELESQLGHKIAKPAAKLGVDLRQTGLLQRSGDTFGDRSAATSYLWRDYVVIIRQGKAVAGFALRAKVDRDDAIFSKRPDGAEQVLLPARVPAGETPNPATIIASGLILSDGWLVQVSMAGNSTAGVVTTEALKTFVASIEL